MCARWLLAAALAPIGCGSSASTDGDSETAPPPPAVCGPGALLLEDGSCLAAGMQDNGCAAGEVQTDAGVCVPPGVGVGDCGSGFTPHEAGCLAVLPDEPCAPGTMAVPGEASCREVAPCASDRFGAAPIDGSTTFVDASYAGSDADGTEAKPWSTIQQGVDAALAGGLVAIAAGTYAEDVTIDGKPVVLWGKCPGEATIVGTATAPAAVVVHDASGAAIHDLGVTGAAEGVEVSASEGVTLGRVWIHDTASRGLFVVVAEGPTTLALTGSLIENTVRLGVWNSGADLTVERSVVRGTAPSSDGEYGDGIFSEQDVPTKLNGNLVVRGSLVEGNHKVGVFVGASNATVEDTLIRDTQVGALGLGRGVQIQNSDLTGARANAKVRRTVVERSVGCGVCIYGSDVEIEAVSVRDTVVGSDDYGRGVNIEPSPGTNEPSIVRIASSVIERSVQMGLFVALSRVTATGLVVRDTAASADNFGRGVNAQIAVGVDGGPGFELLHSIVERSVEGGIFIGGAVARIDGVIVRDTAAGSISHAGRGIDVQPDPTNTYVGSALIRSTLVENSVEIGVAAFGPVTLEATHVRKTAATEAGLFGDGVVAIRQVGGTVVAIRGSLVESNARAGAANFASDVTIERTALTCNPIALDGENMSTKTFSYDDQGTNACGCGDEHEECAAVSSNLEAPASLASTGP